MPDIIDFTVKLFTAVSCRNINETLCPFSIAAALNVILPGASHKTAKELLDVVPDMGAYGNVESVAGLHTATAIWLQSGLNFYPDYYEVLRRMGCSSGYVDFSGDIAEAVRVMNSWISSKTRGKIRDMILADPSMAMARMVVTNAVYFHELWSKHFDKNLTETGWFQATTGRLSVSFMHEPKLSVRMYEGDDYCAVAIPYSSPSTDFLVVLPNSETEREGVEARLATILRETQSDRNRTTVDMYLPKFRADQDFELRNVLKSMGLKRIFTASSELNRITPDEPLLLVDSVQHQTYIDVSELGTTAAASTVARLSKGLDKPKPVFRVDRPFLYAIRYCERPLFIGRVAVPRTLTDADIRTQ